MHKDKLCVIVIMQLALYAKVEIMAKSYRLMYRFWLDMGKTNEEAIADQIELLKNERSFTQTIRDGIRLIVDLRQGNTDVLFELFPLIREKLQTTASGSNGGNGVTKRDIERLEGLILQHGTPPNTAIMQPAGVKPLGGVKSLGGVKPLGAGKLPPIEEDGFTLTAKKASHKGSSNAAANFLASLQATH